MKCSVFSVQCSVAAALLLAATAANSFAQTNQPASLPIDLLSALRLAGAQSLDVQIARERLAEARANHEIARQQFFPWLAPGISYRRHDGQIQDVSGSVFNASKQSYALGGTLTAQVELGEAYYKTLAAKQLKKAADHALAAQELESVFGASQGYFDLLKAQAGVGVAREAVGIAEDYAKQLQRALEAGLAFKGDVLRAQVQAGRNQLALRQALEQQRAASARLAQALHLDSTVELAASSQDLVPFSLGRTNAALDSLVAQALATRPELKEGRALVSAAQRAKEGATFGPMVPTLGAQVSLGGLGGGVNGSTGNFSDSQDYFLGLSWRIGPGGLFDQPRIRASDARLAAARLGVERVRDEIIRQVVEAQSLAHSLAGQIGVAQSALVAADESLRLANARKEFAVGVVLENIFAGQELTRARSDYFTTVAEHNKAQYALARAVGSLIGADRDKRSEKQK